MDGQHAETENILEPSKTILGGQRVHPLLRMEDQMNLRPYQIEAVDHLMRHKRAIIHAPAGSGKTVMMAAALDQYLRTGSTLLSRVVVMANTLEQCDQIKSAFELFRIFDRVAQVQICCAAGKPDTDTADLLIVDECHHAPAPMWAHHIRRATGMRWGFTATPFDNDQDRNQALLDLFGPVLEIGRDQLVTDGHIIPGIVVFADRYDPDIEARIEARFNDLIEQRRRRFPFLFANADRAKEQESQALWQACLTIGIGENYTRDNYIAELAQDHADQGDQVLILTATIEHCERLQLMIGSNYASVCTGKLAKAKRAKMIADFKAEEFHVLIATSLADEGLDVPCASVLIMAGAGRSKTKIIQRTGRVLRPFEGKDAGIIYDFEDSFHGMLRAQSYKRRAQYKQLKYKIQ